MFKKFGPGIFIAAAFVGPGTLTVCTVAGVKFGFALLWTLLVSTIATIVLQEMSGRVGMVSQTGLVEALRSSIQIKWLRAILIFLVLTGILLGNAAYEAGNIGGAVLGISGITDNETISNWSPFLLGGIAFVLLWFGNYRFLERVFVLLVALMGLCFIITAIITKPNLLDWLKGALTFSSPEGSIWTILGLVGTTVVPYNLFLHASLVSEKWSSKSNHKAMRWDTIISISLGGLVSMAIITAAAAAPVNEVNGVMDMATGLKPLLGSWARFVMALGLLAAGITSAITAPLAAAYVAQSCFGWEKNTKGKNFRLVWMLVIATGVVFLSLGVEPIWVIQIAQVANAALLPLIAMLLLWTVNQKQIMAEHKNSGLQNAFGFLIVGFALFLGIKSFLDVFSLI
ncbi:MAG: Nramp family divalent metal transporter [Bacteroidota bacterium]